MGLVATGSNKSYVPAPVGTHPAVCTQVIDLGLQHSEMYDKTAHKCLIGWELPGELDADGKPYMVFKRYTASTNKKATLRQHLEAWRGKPFTDAEVKAFDIRAIAGKPCLVNITHSENDGNTYANVSSVMAIPKGTPAPKATSKPVVFDIDQWDDAVFEGFSDNLKKTINGRVKPTAPGKLPTAGDDDITDKDIPF